MTTAQIGYKSSSFIVPYQSATKRTKTISTVTVTAGTGLSNIASLVTDTIFYCGSDGIWRMDSNINFVANIATGEYVICTINNVVFADGLYQTFTLNVNDANYAAAGDFNCYTSPGGGGLLLGFGTSVTGETGKPFFLSLKGIKLKQEPTTYTTAANMEGAQAADIYIAPYVPGVSSGLVPSAGLPGRLSAASAGYVGETKTANMGVATSTYPGGPAAAASLTLETGIWLVSAPFSYFVNFLGTGFAAVKVRLRDTTNNIELQYADQLSYTNSNSGGGMTITVPVVVTAGSILVNAEVICTANSGTPTGSTAIVRNYGTMTATRIA